MGEAHLNLVEHIEDRVPPIREVPVAGLDELFRDRREHRHVLPDRGAGESGDRLYAHPGCCPGGDLHLLGGPLPHALGVPVTPDAVRQNVPVSLIDGIVADRLALQMVGDGIDLQSVALQDVEPVLDIVVILGGAPGVQVIAPGGDLQAVVAPLACEPGHLLEGQVSPLAGEQCDGSCHQ